MRGLYYSSYGSDHDQYPHLFTILERVKPMNIGVELAIYSRVSSRPQHIENLYKICEQVSQYKTLFHGPYMELEATSEIGSDAAKYMLESYTEAFEICKKFNAPGMVMHTNQRSYEDSDKMHLQANSIDMILKIGKMAERAGIDINVENVGFNYNHSVLFSEDEYIELFDQLPENIGSLIDVGHAILNGWNIKRVVEKLNKRIRAYHIHNNSGVRDEHLPVYWPNMKYSKEMIIDLYRCMEEYSPDADWILEYAPGPHIAPESMEDDFRETLRILDEIHKSK